MNLGYIILGLVFLILGGNWLLKAAVGMSLRLNIPKIIIGMTVVSFATSAPELIVSVKAALDGHPDLSLGNVVGSNIANLALVLAITVILSKIDVEKSFYKTDWPIMMVASGLLYYFLSVDQVIDFNEGVIMLGFLVLFLVYLLKFQKKAVVVDEISEVEPTMQLYKIVLFLFVGGVGLWAGSEFLIKGAVNLAQDFGVSERIIAVTVVSIGTSVPELAASIIAVLKKEKAISLGNLIGSNIFNILAVLGITSMITPIQLKDVELLNYDIFWMLGFSFLIFPLVFFPRKMRLDWKDGFILLILYGIYLFTTLG
ncbi:sodium:calcium antiporter [Polaribacter pacificus]|uniref:Sodium:calcium antiporter n=1 Tax=Polaribacter pacificus TaxID=1775173 RepID=A0A917MFL8_9FLAO|nr:calcium/sodium antiporter [Polaribacter pacificus]GGG97185.1 sodium:calcium antiporter [Polaribacter pacificus]